MPDHAIVIGIDRYPGISDLQGPCNDAKLFRDWLIKPDGGGLDPANVQMRLSSDFPEPASSDDARPFQTEIEALLVPFCEQAVMGAHIKGRLFLYVAGHGFSDPQEMESAALYAANAKELYHTHVAVERYASYLRRLWAFDEIILIFDACRTTLPFQRIIGPPLPEVDAHANAEKVKMFYGYATGFGGAARERVFDGVTYGIFTKTMIAALENAAPNRLGRVTGSIIENYVYSSFREFAGEVAADEPKISVDSRNDVLFLKRAPTVAAAPVGPETLVRLQDPHIGNTLVLSDFVGAEVERHTVAHSEIKLRIEPGLYQARILETGESKLFEVPRHAIVEL